MKLLEKTGRKRNAEIKKLMMEKGFDFLILTQPVSFEYLIFSRIPFLCIISKEKNTDPVIFTHFYSLELVKSETWSNNVVGVYPHNIGIKLKDNVEENPVIKAIEYINSFEGKNKKIGLDFANTPCTLVGLFKKNLVNCEVSDCNSLLLKIYSIKTQEELELLKKAVLIAELGVIKTKKFLEECYIKNSAKLTENELAAFAEYQMRQEDVDGFFVRSSVASGPRSILIGAVDSVKIIKENDIINADYSPVYKRYYADICRPLRIKGFTKVIKDKCKVIEEALDIAISNIKPGIIAKEVDIKVRKHFMEKGFDGEFIHHTGHTIGNAWGPVFTPNSGSVIEEGMVFALEPGLYNSEIGGIRIEDNVYVDKKGSINLMSLPRILY